MMPKNHIERRVYSREFEVTDVIQRHRDLRQVHNYGIT